MSTEPRPAPAPRGFCCRTHAHHQRRPHGHPERRATPRSDGWRPWTAAAGEFGERLAARATPPVVAAVIDTETRRGADYIRIRVTLTVEAADVAGAVEVAWAAFRSAAGDPGAWDLAAATAEVRPASGALGHQGLSIMTAPELPAHVG